MENNIVQRLEAATKTAEAAVTASFDANVTASTAMESLHKLRIIADQATANLDYAHNTCNAYLQQMDAMSKRLQALRETHAIKEMKEILPEATKLKDDFQKAQNALQQAFQQAERANANYELARVNANNLVAEAERLASEAQKALDYAQELGKEASEAL